MCCLFEPAIQASVPRGEASSAVERPDTRSARAEIRTNQEMLLREMQHRVANSLQIVAGILSLKARTVRSRDARLHLMDACNRIMSVATVQRQLLVSRQSSMIRMDHYLSELSESLARSLIEKIRLSVVVEGASMIESNKAIAIGLAMTELIVNALKHAFPKGNGNILVLYRTTGSDWSLSVLDDGIGISTFSRNPDGSGYGTRIVDALANELDAKVIVESNSEGTRVSLVHSIGCAENNMELCTERVIG